MILNRNKLDDYIFRTSDVKMYQFKKVHITKNMAVLLHNLMMNMVMKSDGMHFIPTPDFKKQLRLYTLSDMVDCYYRLGLNNNNKFSDYQVMEARKFVINKQYNAKMRDYNASLKRGTKNGKKEVKPSSASR